MVFDMDEVAGVIVALLAVGICVALTWRSTRRVGVSPTRVFCVFAVVFGVELIWWEIMSRTVNSNGIRGAYIQTGSILLILASVLVVSVIALACQEQDTSLRRACRKLICFAKQP